ncbi:MAG: lysophospholipase [Bacteroidales bacterium]|nr:lysophospholipase [Bacteroidales bacterium]HPD95813.1 lysophospholipase [Tenuifilaceae bacterium]HRX31918.1 lysophospholipase [Tenuifilaceae bacterium]
MEPVKEWWQNSKGHKLFAWHLLPVIQPKAAILLVHGHGEHSWRYLHWAKRFAYHGYAFYSWDHLGHGLSHGQRGHILHYEKFLLEIDRAITKVHNEFPKLPIILYGHSMGGNIALNYCITRPTKVKLLVVTSPWLRLVKPIHPVLDFFSRILAVLLPFIPLKSTVKPEAISHIDEEVQKYKTDPLIHNNITPKLYVAIQNAAKFALGKANRIKIPTLIMQGDSDLVTSHLVTADIAQLIPQSTYIEWSGQYHELHNETRNNEVFTAILEWLDARIK